MFSKGKTTVFCLFMMILATALSGAYLTFQPINAVQPDGSKLSLFASGDEYYNWLHDKDGYTIKKDSKGWYVYVDLNGSELVLTTLVAGRDNPTQRNIAPWTNISAEEMGRKRLARQNQIQEIGGDRVPHSGTINNLVIFIRFSDQTEFGQDISYYNAMFNGAGNTLQAYFAEASYNALNISTTYYPISSTTVVSWQDSHPRAYFSPYNATTNPTGYTSTNATSREHTLLAAAVAGVRAAIPTSLNLDGDNDGKVDNVCFVIKGATDGWAELLWPHRWSLFSNYTYINSKRVYDYNLQLSDFLAGSGNGVLCHEMFHSLGAPDLYHYTGNGISPVGGWDLMESNANPPEHMSAYMKWKYVGWISSIPVASTTGVYTLNPLTSSTNNCYRINSPNSTSQYFVVEYRKKTGQFESSVPNSGMVIYRINTAASGNASGPPDEVYAFRPNGTSTVNGDINNAQFSEEAGRIIFNQYTNPYPYLYNASSEPVGGISLQAISSSAGNTMSFTLASGDPLSQLNEGFESGIPAGWSNTGNAVWANDTTTYFSGARSLKSGTITHNQTTSIQSSMLALYAGQVSFFYKISSESGYDYLKFYIDGVEKAKWSGEGNWAMVAFNITVGNHILKWEYMKDGSVDTGSDCAWIDHVSYPLATFNPPRNLSGLAGNNSAVLSWDAPVSGTPSGYRIYRNGTLLTTTTALTYTDNAVINTTLYTYYVIAAYAGPTGYSAASNTVSVTPTAAAIITIGTETAINQSLPVEPYYGYTYSQSIYLQSEINAANGRISKLAWQYNGNSIWSNDEVKIWMGHTTETAFASTTGWLPVTALTQVFDGTLSVTNTPGWVELTLNTPFVYNNTANLVIAVDENTTGYHLSSDEFYCSAVTGNRSIFYYSDSYNTDPMNPITAMSTPAYVPNVKLFFEDVPQTAVFNITPSTVDFGTVEIFQTPSRQMTVTNTGRTTLQINSMNLSNSVQFQLQGVPASYPVNLVSGGSLSFTVRFSPVEVGTFASVLTINDNLSRTSHPIALTGTCVDTALLPPATQDFETFIPSGWTQFAGLIAEPTILTTGSSWVADGFGNNGTTGAARLNIWSTGTRNWLMSPTINLGSGAPGMSLEFDMSLTAYNTTNAPNPSGADDKFAVVISTDNGVNWSSANVLRLWDNTGSANVYNSIPASGMHVIIPLSTYTGRIKLAFYGESTLSNADNDITIDNVVVTPIPSMLAVPVPAISRNGGNLHLEWTAVPGATRYQIYRSGSSASGFELLETVTENYLNITESNPCYFYRVMAVNP